MISEKIAGHYCFKLMNKMTAIQHHDLECKKSLCQTLHKNSLFSFFTFGVHLLHKLFTFVTTT